MKVFVLSVGAQLRIKKNIAIKVVSVSSDRARLGINAPKNVDIVRTELINEVGNTRETEVNT